jgi:hypothetical protein
MVEFALVFPMLLLIAVSLADYGYYIEHADNVDTIVRDATRFATLNSTSGGGWSSACPTPTWIESSGAWSCAGVAAQVAGGFSQPASYFDGSVALPVTSVAGFGPGLPGNVAVSVGGSSTVLLDCQSAVTSPADELTDCLLETGSGTVAAGDQVAASSDYIEGVIQQEGESLTVPEGGLALDNVDCCWSLSGCTTTPPSSPGSLSQLQIPSGDVSCMSIAYYSGDSSYGASLTLKGWYSASAGCYLPAGDTTCPATESYPTAGDLVQVTISYNYTAENPGPVFTILNSVFALQAQVVGQYSMVVIK